MWKIDKAIDMKKRIKTALLLITLLILLNFILAAFSIVRYGETDEKTHCDAAIVLGAGTWDGEVSAVYRERINHGIWLYENGYVDYLILTGGMGEGNQISDAEAAKRYAISQSVPEDAILIEDKSTITEENLEFSKEIMEAHDLHTAIIVSDPLHMKRAMRMAEDYGLTSFSSPTPTTMYRSFKTKVPFLFRETFFYVGYSIVRLFR
jgi:uncharacterized SAM-binding protein YcdF (DUF218 family)